MFSLRCVSWAAMAIGGWGAVAAAQGSDKTSPGVPIIHVAEKTVDAGTIREGEVAEVIFKVENHGSADLKIHKVRTSCGCTTVPLTEEQKTVPAGGHVMLTAKFNSRSRSGKQKKSITIQTNDPKQPRTTVYLTALVRRLFVVTPKTVAFRMGRRGNKLSPTVELRSGESDKTVELLEVEIDNPAVGYEIQQSPKPGVVQLAFTLARDAPLGQLFTIAKIKVRVGAETADTSMPIRGDVVGDITHRPNLVQTVHPTVRGQRLAPVTVFSPDKKPFEVLEVDAGPNLEVTSKPSEDHSSYRFQMTVGSAAPAGPFGTWLSVFTDNVDQPVVRVPVFAVVGLPVNVDPPVVFLRRSSTAIDDTHRVVLRTADGSGFDITGVESDLRFVTVEPEAPADTPRPGVRHLRLRAAAEASVGTHQGVVRIHTTVAGAETITLPVTLRVAE